MNGKKLLQIELFHPVVSVKSGVPRGLTLANSILLSIAFGTFFNDLFHLQIHIIMIIMLSTLFSYIILLYDKNKGNLLCYLIIIGVIITVALIGKAFQFSYIEGIRKVYEWCLVYDREDINYQRLSGLAVMTGILLLSCIITYVLHRYKNVKNFVAVLLILLLIISSINSVVIPKITVAIILLYSLTILVEFCGRFFYKSSNVVDNSIATMYLAPACVIIAMSAILLPSNPKPIQWKGIKNIIVKVQEQGSIWMTQLEYFIDRTGNEFTVNFSGYSDEDEEELGGDVTISEKTSLRITTQSQSIARGYLIGSISDSYTGRKWEKSEIVNNNQRKDYDLDFFELLTALTQEQAAGNDINNLIKLKRYQIEYHDIRTRTLFYPLKTVKIKFRKEVNLNETGQGAFLFQKAKGIGTKYDIQYYELNLNREQLQNMLRDGGREDYAVTEGMLQQVAKDLFKLDASDLDMDIEQMKQDLVDRSNRIKTMYTTLPDTLPVRVKQLAYELTKDYNKDYDKLKAIERYLNTLTYTTRGGRTPRGEDFVDYFLFEQQQGYCTYFASAMGILSRCVGIPTRYVEGYVIDYKVKVDNNTYKVLSSNSHAWIDAYIEGIGWIPFEATPGFYAGRYTPWKDVMPNYGYDTSGVNTEHNTALNPNYQDLVEDVKAEYSVENDSKVRTQYIIAVISILLSILLLFASIILAYNNLLIRKYNRKFKNASNNMKLSLTLAEILRYLAKEGYKLSPEDTLLTYAERIGDKIKYNNINVHTVTDIFMRVRYGEKEVKDEELQLVMEFCKELEQVIRAKLGKRKMFFDRFSFLYFYQ